MVKTGFTPQGVVTSAAEAERALVLAYAPRAHRAALAAVLALDDTLAAVLRTTSEPMVGQIRLTWWHDALTRLDTAPPPAQPVLTSLAADVLPAVRGSELAELVAGWEELLDPDDPDDATLARYAEGRGARLFVLAGRMLGAAPRDPLAAAGRGWALLDLATHSSGAGLSDRARALGLAALEDTRGVRWSRAGRPLGAMTHLARLRGRGGLHGVGRALFHRLTGF